MSDDIYAILSIEQSRLAEDALAVGDDRNHAIHLAQSSRYAALSRKNNPREKYPVNYLPDAGDDEEMTYGDKKRQASYEVFPYVHLQDGTYIICNDMFAYSEPGVNAMKFSYKRNNELIKKIYYKSDYYREHGTRICPKCLLANSMRLAESAEL